MAEARVEHINLTVKSPLLVAEMLVDLFDWRIRWQGEAINGGISIHVGGTATYIALYTNDQIVMPAPIADTHDRLMNLNHLGIVVDDLDATEGRVKAAGFQTYAHGDYEPGRRFYFDNRDGLEIEVVSYTSTAD